MFKPKEKEPLTLQCCFCNRHMERDQKIEIGKMHQCLGCDSSIEALAPIAGSKCEIGCWQSLIA